MSVEPVKPGEIGVARSSDTQRMMGIYEESFDRIHRYCLCRLFKREVAQDATSAVFARMIEEFDSLKDKTQEGVVRWLYAAANTVVTNQVRTERRRTEILQEVARQREGQRHGKAIFDRLDWPVLYGAILKLKPNQQDVVVLRYFEGLDLEELADRLKMKPITVRVTLSRAIRKLRKELGARHEA